MIRLRHLDRSDRLLPHPGIMGSCGYGDPTYRKALSWYSRHRTLSVVDQMIIRRTVAELRRLTRIYPAFWRRVPSAIMGLSIIRNRLLEN